MITLLGIASGCLTTLSWLPQLLRTWRTRHADDISVTWLLAFGSGVAGWVAYGVLKSDVAVIFANALTLLLLGALIAMKYLRAAAPPEPAASGPQPR
jgi:MtN3 and saliva related transmembrane protein